MVAHEAPVLSPEKQTQPSELPKSREIFTGDINDAVITVQQITGFEITPEWWANEVGNEGPTEDILDRFDTAFEKFVHHEKGFDTDEDANVLQYSVEQEADNQLAEFDATVPEGPDKPYLREEFIDALAEHLKEKYFLAAETDSVFSEYTGYDDVYRLRNEERAKTGRVKVAHYGNDEITTVASINVDPVTGEAINGHDHRPEAISHKETEAAWQEYLLATPETERFVIFEGEPDFSRSRDEAIVARSDSGLLQFMARESDIPRESVISGDPDADYARLELQKRGFSPEDIKLYELVRHLSHDPKHKSEDLNLELYGAAALVGVEGFAPLTEEQKVELRTQADGIHTLRAQAAELAQDLNKKFEELGLPQFIISTEGEVQYESQALEALNKSWDPRSEGLLADIQRASLEIRDKYLFEQIVAAREQGKKPFVVFGGSHISALEPALERL